MSDATEWLRDPALTRLWAAARTRLEGRGLIASGSVTIRELTRDERRAIGGLLGRTLVSERVSVDLAALDADLVRRSGLGGLVAVVEAVLETTLISRPVLRSARAAQREAPFVAARDWLRLHPMGSAAWIDPWLAALRHSGVLTRAADGSGQLCQALRVLATVTERRAPQTRTMLAAAEVGNAHALDDGTLLSHLVLRGLAAASGGQAAARTTGERRELWERFGVSADAVSSTCLVLGLHAHGTDGVAARVNAAAADGDPIHLTVWDLRRLDGFAAEQRVLVCENPAVLEAAAQRVAGAALVCSSGQPALIVLEVLQRLAAGSTSLRYHGDFDWPGIAIANRLVAHIGVLPWLMNAVDYRAAAVDSGHALALAGAAVEPSWDGELGTAMQHGGIAVHEEAVLDQVLDALDGWRRG